MFSVCYIAFALAAIVIAPSFGRVPISCISDGTYKVQSPLYCALNRQYVTPELKRALDDFAGKLNSEFPDTTTLILDANFPFIDGFPLLPHLSHSDGRKVDLAFYYQDQNQYLPERTRSPIGYFAFEDGPSNCPDNVVTLRWDLDWLQWLWPEYGVEPKRMRFALELLAADKRIGKVLIEPHLMESLGVDAGKIRFQGCRAARHDDHIHVQL